MKEKPNKPHFQVAAGLIWKGEELLISKRKKGSHLEGFWEFPGGKQKNGETLEVCLKREIHEELGIVAKVKGSLITVDHEYTSKSISLHIFNCIYLSGDPKPLEAEEIKWVTPKELKDFIFPPPDLTVIDYILKKQDLR